MTLPGFMASLLVGIICFTVSESAHSQQPNEAQLIQVAAYEFPPYFSSGLDEHLVGSIVEALNQRQQFYQFAITEVRPTQRHRALAEDGCCDVMLFEDPKWGWGTTLNGEIITGPALTYGADLYMSAEDPLEVLQSAATVGGVQGYHYELTGYQHDTDVLEQEHSLYLADNQMTLLNMLRRERLDVVIISQELLLFLQSKDSPLLAGYDYKTAVDQQYLTRIVGRHDRGDLVAWLEAELTMMWESGELEQVFQRFGMADNLRFTPAVVSTSGLMPAL